MDDHQRHLEKLYDIEGEGLNLFDLDLFDLDLPKIVKSWFIDKLIHKLEDITDFNYKHSHKFPKEIKDCLCILLTYLKEENEKVIYKDEIIELFIDVLKVQCNFDITKDQIKQWVKNQRRQKDNNQLQNEPKQNSKRKRKPKRKRES